MKNDKEEENVYVGMYKGRPLWGNDATHEFIMALSDALEREQNKPLWQIIKERIKRLTTSV